jgi:hypothetical protein
MLDEDVGGKTLTIDSPPRWLEDIFLTPDKVD